VQHLLRGPFTTNIGCDESQVFTATPRPLAGARQPSALSASTSCAQPTSESFMASWAIRSRRELLEGGGGYRRPPSWNWSQLCTAAAATDRGSPDDRFVLKPGFVRSP